MIEKNKNTIPKDFILQMQELLGEKECEKFLDNIEKEAPVSLRLNKNKIQKYNLTSSIFEKKVAWCDSGIYLSERIPFTFDPLLHAGLYYVQEASSMFVSTIIKQYVKNRVLALDLCAAPGGKSLTILNEISSDSLLFSNEPDPIRVKILQENLSKSGFSNVIVTNNYPNDYVKAKLKFNVILVDAPCSGEGMFRKDIVAREQWNIDKVNKCSVLQREILTKAVECLANDGILIYSTCTYNTKENELNTLFIANDLNLEPIFVEIKDEWNITSSLNTSVSYPIYRFLPHKTKGEGLFICAFRKKEIMCNKKEIKVKRNEEKKLNKDYKNWISNNERFTFIENEDRVTAFLSEYSDIFNSIKNKLKVIQYGITIATKKNKKLIPTQQLALSQNINTNIFENYEVNYDSAIKFLRKETLNLPEHIHKGYVLITYKNVPLGFVNNIGNRANNMYPSQWRILSTHIPNKYKNILE